MNELLFWQISFLGLFAFSVWIVGKYKRFNLELVDLVARMTIMMKMLTARINHLEEVNRSLREELKQFGLIKDDQIKSKENVK